MLLLAFHKANKRKDKVTKVVDQPTKARVTIPYISGLSERIKNSFGKPTNKLRDKLVHVKYKESKEKRSNLVWDCVRW